MCLLRNEVNQRLIWVVANRAVRLGRVACADELLHQAEDRQLQS